MIQELIERCLHPACSPVFIRDYGLRVQAEYRIGDVVTCEAVMIKTPDEGWIIDQIETAFAWRRKGHAEALLRRVMEVSGHPVIAHDVQPEALPFWHRMVELGIHKANVKVSQEAGEKNL